MCTLWLHGINMKTLHITTSGLSPTLWLVQYTCALPQGANCLFTFDNLPLASSEVVCVHVPVITSSCLIEYIFCYGIEKACYYTADHLHLRHSSSESDWST